VQDELCDILKDEKSLKEFIAALRDFNQAFCDAIVSKVDFSIKLEVRGEKGEMLFARVDTNSFRRPKGRRRKD